MIPQEQIKEFKILIGMFHEEMKSNSVTDLVVWLDCKLEYDIKRETEMRGMYKKWSQKNLNKIKDEYYERTNNES